MPVGSVVVTVPTVAVELVVAGSVSDFTDERKTTIKQAFAAQAGVTVDKVEVDVRAASGRRLQSSSGGSVIVDVAIQVEDAAAAGTVTSSLSTQMASASAASTFLSVANVSVEAAPHVVETTTLVVMGPPPPSPPSPPPSPPPLPPPSPLPETREPEELTSGSSVGTILIIAGGALCAVLAGLGLLVCVCMRRKKALPADGTVELSESKGTTSGISL